MPRTRSTSLSQLQNWNWRLFFVVSAGWLLRQNALRGVGFEFLQRGQYFNPIERLWKVAKNIYLPSKPEFTSVLKEFFDVTLPKIAG